MSDLNLKAEIVEIQGVLWIIAGLLTDNFIRHIFFFIGICAVLQACVLHYLKRMQRK